MQTTKVEFFSRRHRNRLLGPSMALLTAACTLGAGPKSSPPPAAPVALQPAPPASPALTRSGDDQNNADSSNNGGKAAPAAATSAAPPAGDAVLKALAYSDRVRAMSNGELSQQAARLGGVPSPADQMQLALVLSQSRQTAEVIRSQDLLTRLLANMSAEAQALHPLARLLAARLGEQRRFEDLLDRQSQLARDLQRRLDQTLERLEALKAIERSMTRRPSSTPTTPASAPSTPAPAPAGRARNATPVP